MTKILLIEDDQILLKMYAEKFQKGGFQVSSSEGGEEGLIKAETEKPDFIILDWIMPKVNGGMVLRQLKRNPVTKDIPVAILSVMTPDVLNDLDKEMMSQIVGFWQKDRNNPSEILRKVRENLTEQ